MSDTIRQFDEALTMCRDIFEKKLEDYNDVFADTLNTLLFKKDLILPSLLEDGP